MEKFIAVVFDTEEAAIAGAEALRALHRNGELAVYAAAVIGKDPYGTVEVKKAQDEGPIGTAFGLMLGAMVGVLAGPAVVASGAAVAGTAAAGQAALGGMAAGGLAGGMFGAYRDLWVAGIDMALLDQVALELLPGKSCIVASVDEVWTAPLDAKMTAAGGVVFRKPRVDAVDEQWEAEMRAMDRELAALDDELMAAEEASRAAIKEKIGSVKSRIEESDQKINARLDAMDAEMNARLDALDEQIEQAATDMKDKFVKRKEEVQEEYRRRKAKLKKSADLARDALTT
ncbi:hypothetical protein LCL97_11560 [Seohaeicola saemankumensis]|nr:hypothetical protein [Seohaeicola saemankumensis]MCA0871466.1 hypothetical protein [Seohaeicola saemankumensis]